jgi:DNA-binding beta-propeller fold protein YncE
MHKLFKFNLHFFFIVSLLLVGCADNKNEELAFVTTEKGGVSIINLETYEVTQQLENKDKPRGVGITRDGRYLVTANKGSASINLIDLKSDNQNKQIEVGENPEFIRVYGDHVFVSTEPSSKGKPMPEKKHDAAKKEDDDDDDDDDDDEEEPARIKVVNITNGKIIQDIEAGIETEGIEFTHDRQAIIVTNENDSTVSVHDIKSGDQLASIDLKSHGKRPRGIKRSPVGNFYAVTMEHSDNVVLIANELNRYSVIESIPTGKNPYGLMFSEDGQRLYVLASKSQQMLVYDMASREVFRTVDLNARRCWHMSFSPSVEDILIACGGSDEFLVLDAMTYAEKKRLKVPGKPWGVITYPKTFGSLDEPVYK